MKAKQLSNKFINKEDTKESLNMKTSDSVTEFERQLQNEVKMFMNSASSQRDQKKSSKKNLQTQADIDDICNNINDNKNLNASKYAAKLLKKSKLKENNHSKIEKRMKKKRKELKEKKCDIQGGIHISSDYSRNSVEENIHKVKNKKQKETDQKNKVLSGRISKKKEEKKRLYEIKILNRKFDNMNISQDSGYDSKVLGKRKRNRRKKLLKKERLLRIVLKKTTTGSGLTEAKLQVGKNRPSIETLTIQIKNLKKEQPESKKVKKRKLHTVNTEGNKMNENLEEKMKKSKKIKEDNQEKKKKKKSKKNIENSGSDHEKPMNIGDDNHLDVQKTKLKNIKKVKKEKKKSKSKIEIFDSNNDMPTKKRKPNQPDEDMKKCDGNVNGVSNEIEALHISGGHKREKFYNSKNKPLREKLMNKLKAARFRFLNEQLYTSMSSESKNFFSQDRESFEAYHEGFKQQVTQWPINPVDVIIKSLQERKSSKRLLIADMGCGEAKLSSRLEQHKVHSLDLVALNDRVTPCDMTHTPLKTGSLDVVVFCLSLMGTDLGACVKEANRILKLGGEMKIAEVESRFHDVNEFVKDLQKYGFENTELNMQFSIFCFLDFKKVSNLSQTRKKKLPEIKLKPCLYKKR